MLTRRISMEVRQAKTTLRQTLKQRLASMNAEERQKQTEAVITQLLARHEYVNARRISTYLSMREEVGTEKLLTHMFNAGKKVFIPRYAGQQMEMLHLRSIEDYSSLPLTKWNIKQPSLDDSTRENALDCGLDLVVVPGLGFTADGKRLGRGKGYYDTFLRECRARMEKKPFLVALAYDCQIVQEHADDPFPFNEEHDERIDLVLFPSRIYST